MVRRAAQTRFLRLPGLATAWVSVKRDVESSAAHIAASRAVVAYGWRWHKRVTNGQRIRVRRWRAACLNVTPLSSCCSRIGTSALSVILHCCARAKYLALLGISFRAAPPQTGGG